MAKNYWLIKSEPSVYPFSRLLVDGKTAWDGVRNFEARNNLRAMKSGDLALYYHSNEGKEIVGIARVSREAYPDPGTDEDWSAVDFEPVKALDAPLGLAAIKAHPRLNEMHLVKKSRISVCRVTKAELDLVLKLTKTRL